MLKFGENSGLRKEALRRIDGDKSVLKKIEGIEFLGYAQNKGRSLSEWFGKLMKLFENTFRIYCDKKCGHIIWMIET